MKNSKFSHPPIPKKNKTEQDFIDGHEEKITSKPKKETTKPIFFRAPQSLADDLHELMALTGLSMKSICIDLLRTEIKRKLKEF